MQDDINPEKYYFTCKCSINQHEQNKKEFVIIVPRKLKGIILKCLNCGHLISRNIKALKKQNGKNKT